MEFLKSCKTNVRLLGLLSNITYQKFRNPGVGAPWTRAHACVRILRDQSILCACSHDGIVTFSLAGNAVEDDQHQTHAITSEALNKFGFTEDGNGTLAKTAGTAESDLAALRDLLCRAIEASINMTMSHQHGLLHCGQGKWLYDVSTDGSGLASQPICLELNLDFSDGDKLFATTVISESKLGLLRDTSKPSPVLLAPFGQPAKLDTAATSGDHTTSDASRSMVTDALRAEGIVIDANESWLFVRPSGLGSSRSIPWPSSLLIACRDDDLPTHSRKEDWKNFFVKPGAPHGYRDSMAFAEEWFVNGVERERRVASKTIEPASSATGDTFVTNFGETMTAQSPASLLRPTEQHLTFSGIYPTPPDGLVPTGQAPQVGTEGMTASQSADPGNSINDFLPDAEPIREQSVNSLHGGQQMTTHDNDLFGESVAGMGFSNGEVGDADFSFFDEMPETASTLDAAKTSVTPLGIIDEHIMDDVVHEAKLQVPTEAESTATNEHETKDDEIIIDTSTDAAKDVSITAQHNEVVEHATPMTHDVDKPLSPFGIRERLLPPPIPASMSLSTTSQDAMPLRRKSTFEPVVFREGLDIVGKYGGRNYNDSQERNDRALPSIGLPAKRKRESATSSRIRNRQWAETRDHEQSRNNNDIRETDDDDDEMSDDDSTSDSDDENHAPLQNLHLPPRLPWDAARKRRSQYDFELSQADTFSRVADNADIEDSQIELYERIFSAGIRHEKSLIGSTWKMFAEDAGQSADQSGLGEIQSLFAFDRSDLIIIAQLAAEQHISSLPSSNKCSEHTQDVLACDGGGIHGLSTLFENAVQRITPIVSSCDLNDLVIVREAPGRALTGPGQNPRPGQPRPPQRAESISLGPDISIIPLPYVRVSRGSDTYEMLPNALTFWEPLSLGPVNGMRDVRAFCVLPCNDDVIGQAKSFIKDVGLAYEGSKLGSYHYQRNVKESDSRDVYDDGMVPVEIEGEKTVAAALVAYMEACSIFGTFLSTLARTEPERTFLVYVVDPFGDVKSRQHICAVFWGLYKSYREGLGESERSQPCSDLTLQIIPAQLFAPSDLSISAQTAHIAGLARDIYDRCPPAKSQTTENRSALPDFTAPFVELAQAPPKRIGFQLTSEPLSDLLHEGSTLHLAYSMSDDGDWMTTTWTDNSGRYTRATSFCLRGKSMADVVEEVWVRTRETMQAREVFWRVYILCDTEIDSETSKLWRETIETPRKQPFSVTLVYIRTDPGLQLRRPWSTSEDVLSNVPGGGTGAGFLTPVTTPQATNSHTVSPDAAGLSNAPPTPAPSESMTGLNEHDPDAHLIDIREDTWAVILSPAFARSSPPSAFVSGMLFQRGETGLESGTRDSASYLPALRTELVWTVQVRPQGVVDEGNMKQAEMTTREMLRLFRNLNVLTKAKGLSVNDDGKQGILPFHLVAAIRGAKGVNRLLGHDV